MFLYLDTNVYISARYRFTNRNFSKLQELIINGDVRLLYTSLTVGEVEQHIIEDVKKGITEYNRVIRNSIPVIEDYEKYGIHELSVDEIIDETKNSFRSFLNQDGVEKIDLNPIDAELLMDDYFTRRFPFENKKPFEFKDAIAVNAIKQSQKKYGETIYVVSSDEGFRRSFEGMPSIITVEFLGNFFRLYYEQKRVIDDVRGIISVAIDNCEFDETLINYFNEYDIDRSYYSEWECIDMGINEIETEILYLEPKGDGFIAHVSTVVFLTAEIIHRDEDTSFYDKEEERYLIENYVKWHEHHQVVEEVDVFCKIQKSDDGSNEIIEKTVIKNRNPNTLYLSEETMDYYSEIDTEVYEEPDIIYCNECGKTLGHSTPYTDYYENPLCADCMISNFKGDICPSCGKKVPHDLMMSGFCKNCYTEQN